MERPFGKYSLLLLVTIDNICSVCNLQADLEWIWPKLLIHFKRLSLAYCAWCYIEISSKTKNYPFEINRAGLYLFNCILHKVIFNYWNALMVWHTICIGNPENLVFISNLRLWKNCLCVLQLHPFHTSEIHGSSESPWSWCDDHDSIVSHSNSDAWSKHRRILQNCLRHTEECRQCSCSLLPQWNHLWFVWMSIKSDGYEWSYNDTNVLFLSSGWQFFSIF